MDTDYKSILKRYWGYDDFRGIQLDIIESIGSGHDTLGLMPTGGGKSVTFQVPALAQEGVCLVITPLIALMNDQVAHLRHQGIRAAAVHTGMAHDDILKTLENAVFGAVKLLYVSPERLSSELFLAKLQRMKVSFICVDEAHCISQWGYDFRPSYLTIAQVRSVLPHCPVLALTATATPQVITDIQDKLRRPSSSQPESFNVFRMSFERKNLSYIVEQADDKNERLLHLLNLIEGSAIVYARSRQATADYAKLISQAGISTTFFHAGLDSMLKKQRQQDWQQGKVRVMVATNAFGMGIDKADVRLVVHVDCPDSIEAYFQEAGRAGRDGQPASAILLYNGSDRQKLLRRIDDTFPDKDYIRRVYDQLSYFYEVAVGSGYHAVFELPIDRFCQTYKHFPTRVESALRILQRAGYMDYHEETESRARVRFLLERDDLYRLRGNTETEDKVIVALLRSYSGLFVDYKYIDESLIAKLTELSVVDVYLTLKLLAQKRIIGFIPQRSSPYVRYSQRREESQYLVFPREVYDDLKERYTKRIHAMIDYADSQQQCRSRMLLRYFGEEKSDDCGHCDVCMSRVPPPQSDDERQQAEYLILQLLADGQPHPIGELHGLRLPYKAIEDALSYLIAEEQIIDDDGMLYQASAFTE